MKRAVLLVASTTVAVLLASKVALVWLTKGARRDNDLGSKTWLSITTLVLAVALAGGCVAEAQTVTAPQKPNILFILTDDMALTDTAFMPQVRSLLGGEGATFKNAFVTDPLCCPSRTTMLRGQYAHNHGVLFNELPWGGYNVFYNNGLERSTLATWLDSAGYKTALVGKYLNEYCSANECPVEETHVPAGWDEWYAWTRLHSPPTMNINGSIVEYPTSFPDNVISNRAANFITRQGDAPWFLWVSTKAPHGPLEPEPDFADYFEDELAPRPPSFDEEDVSDKPSFLANRSNLTDEQVSNIDEAHRQRLRMLQSVDKMVERLVSLLRDRGDLDDTYIVFTSDNGYHAGQHRLLPGKNFPYEEDIRVPLIVRGPNVPAGTTREELVLNNDLAPTFADLAGADIPDFVDGRSLTPLLPGGVSPARWRTAFMVEGLQGELPSGDLRNYKAVRTKDHIYVEWWNGERELYDLTEDPYQLNNLAGQGIPEEAALNERLEALVSCKGVPCTTAEGGADDTPPRVERAAPARDAKGVYPAVNVQVYFSEPAKASSIDASTFKLYKSGSATPIAAEVRYDATAEKAVLDPDAPLSRGKRYRGVVTTRTRDVAGNRLDQDPTRAGMQPKTWEFTVRGS